MTKSGTGMWDLGLGDSKMQGLKDAWTQDSWMRERGGGGGENIGTWDAEHRDSRK